MADAPQRTGRRVSLSEPRPEAARVHNEYLEAPLPPCHHENNNKKPPATLHQPKKSGPPPPPPPDSIICSECGKCRCESCREPRRPPSAWLCSDFCYCSVDSCVDYTSCLCCVKGLLYHCGPREDWADDPCSCTGSRWLARWSCLGLASLFLPCLCCYCPLRACADACESGYAACTHRGCTCQRRLLESPQLSSHSTV
ncbi:protein sprouty homolog 3 [Halyomorpha halys]|uniref:protein sprouty homolog 3 n=1 Tax=Halyomorpha halys TaxID=286706 RepID=UPI0006D512D8|nr:protein sprouty homolog 3 [Halyomorpha halys]XP_024217205.1 protein sprouty homolog 3 [Halyomorpha halys]